MNKKHFFALLKLLICVIVVQTISLTDSIAQANEEQTEQHSSQKEEGSESSEDSALTLGLSDVIEENLLAEGWLASFDEFAQSWGLSSSTVGRGMATILGFILLFAFYYTFKFIVRKLVASLNSSAKFSVRAPTHRINNYTKVINYVLFFLLLSAYVMILCSIWSDSPSDNFIFGKASGAVRLLTTFLLLFCLGCVVFEFAQSLFNRVFSRWGSSDSARDQTLLPIARNVVNITLFVLLGLTIISELGINIMPVLASAGVLGFAIGFGAQTLVKDLLTGFIIIFEDLIQVGDVVSVGGKSGLVEKITIRKVQLRNLEGIVSTVPFSEISIVENMTKDFSYYLFDVGIAYREDPDEVIKLLKEIGAELKQDEDFKNLILDDLEILGLDKFADSAIIIKARFKTIPIKQWQVGREFNRRMKYRFDEAGIEIPFPHQTIYFGEDKQGKAPPAHLTITSQESANEGTINNESKKSGTDDTPMKEEKRGKKDGYTDDDQADGEAQ